MLSAGRTAAALWRLLVSWLMLWAGFWLSFFAMLVIGDPESVDPGEPAAFARLFALLGLASGLLWSLGVMFLPKTGSAGAGLVRCACLGAAAAAAMPVLLGKFSQSIVFAPPGAVMGAVLAYLARAGAKLRPAGGAWAAMLCFVARGFQATTDASPSPEAGLRPSGPQNVP
ncbi:MAG: hypothetical protein ACP5UT_06715 [Bryobacteraceae bacterium]